MVVLRQISLVLLLSALPLKAEWFSATGEAVIFSDNVALARQQAARAAIRKILNEQRVSLAAIQHITAVDPKQVLFQLTPASPVQQIVISEEYQKDNRLSVTVEADVWPDRGICNNDAVTAKAVSLAPLSIDPQLLQVASGNSELLEQLNKRFNKAINSARADFVVKNQFPAALAVSPQLHDLSAQQQALANLATQQQVQFFISGHISNLNWGKSDGSLFSVDSYARQLALEVTLYDGASGAAIDSRNYHIRSNWHYDPAVPVAAASDQLWRSDFGSEALRVIHQAVDDAAATLSCAALKAHIVKLGNGGAIIAAGKRQGVMRGDRFSLLRSAAMFGTNSSVYPLQQPTDISLTITEVYTDYALAVADNRQHLLSMQIRDLVQLERFRGAQSNVN